MKTNNKTQEIYFYRSIFESLRTRAENISEVNDITLFEKCKGEVIDSYIPQAKGKVYSEEDRIFFCRIENGQDILVPTKCIIQ